jgi:hypothetical protein
MCMIFHFTHLMIIRRRSNFFFPAMQKIVRGYCTYLLPLLPYCLVTRKNKTKHPPNNGAAGSSLWLWLYFVRCALCIVRCATVGSSAAAMHPIPIDSDIPVCVPAVWCSDSRIEYVLGCIPPGGGFELSLEVEVE